MQRSTHPCGRGGRSCAAFLTLSASPSRVDAQGGATDKVPITTSSAEARELYLKGRDLAVTRAAALAGKVSEGEKHMVLGLDAAMKGNVSEVLSH